jgi:hypothetical protein
VHRDLPSFALEEIPTSIRLTASEQKRKEELERIVEHGLEEFLRTGAALAEIRNRRLYRVEFATFAEYCRTKFNLARSTADQLVRSSQTAETLLEAGADLSRATEATIRPLCALPDDSDLRAATWEFVQSISPEVAPTEILVSRVCTTIRNVLSGVQEQEGEEGESSRAGFYAGPRKARAQIASPKRELPFIGAMRRLSRWQNFSVQIVCSSADGIPSATNLHQVCGVMIQRCSAVRQHLETHFPELAHHA